MYQKSVYIMLVYDLYQTDSIGGMCQSSVDKANHLLLVCYCQLVALVLTVISEVQMYAG